MTHTHALRGSKLVQAGSGFGRWLSGIIGHKQSALRTPVDFRPLVRARVNQLKRKVPTVEIPVGAAFDIRKPVSAVDLGKELDKQLSLVKRRTAKPVAVVFSVRKGNAERMRAELSSALQEYLASNRVRSVGFYFVEDPDVSKEEAVKRFNIATGGRGQVKARDVDATLAAWRTPRTA